MASRAAIISQIDPERLYAQFGVALAAVGGGYVAYCPFHEDSANGRPNLSVGADGEFKCFRCGFPQDGAPVFVALMRRDQQPQRCINGAFDPPVSKAEVGSALRWLQKWVGLPSSKQFDVEQPPQQPQPKASSPAITWEEVEGWAMALRSAHQSLAYLQNERRLSNATVEQMWLGYDDRSGRITIPVVDSEGVVRNVRKYKPPHARRAREPKVVSYAKGYGGARWSRPLDHNGGRVVIFAGEMDWLVAVEQQIAGAVCMCCGEGEVPHNLLPDLAGREVYIWYDADAAGRDGGQRLAAAVSAHAASVALVAFPGDIPEDSDFSDFVVRHGADHDACEAQIVAAGRWQLPSSVATTDEAVPVVATLFKAGAAEYANAQQRLEVRAFVVGKDTAPYLAPERVEYVCPDGAGTPRPCRNCPLVQYGGRLVVAVAARHEQLMRTIGGSGLQKDGVLKEIVGIPHGCRSAHVQILSRQNLELVTLHPPLARSGINYNERLDEIEREHIERTAYIRGHGIITNREYVFTGYTGATARGVVAHVFDAFEPVEASVGEFCLAGTMRQELARAFRPRTGQTITSKMEEIADDLAANVTGIVGRLDLHIAYDLVAHSVSCGFSFRGRHVNRSWAQALVIGDTRQGKSETAESLHRHYRAGGWVSSEGLKRTGLLGGCVKRGEDFYIKWGLLPQMTGRMLVVDELHDLQSGVFQEISTARHSGIAELTMVVGAKTSARTRLLCLSNPKKFDDGRGRRMDTYTHGVEATIDLVGALEDISRFDFALTVASGEVPTSVINTISRPVVEHRHTSDLCHTLLMWVWSRQPNQVSFSDDAEVLCLRYADLMGSQYAAECPLVEVADQRYKLARLAASVAGRLFATDEAGERLLVTTDHVEYAYRFLQAAYSKPSMAYGEYSEQVREHSSLTPEMAQEIAKEMAQFAIVGPGEHTPWVRLIDVLRALGPMFQTRQLEDLFKDRAEALDLVGVLVRRNLVRVTSHGYRKTKRFTSWLRAAEPLGGAHGIHTV